MEDKRDCENCIHRKKAEVNGKFFYSCEKWECEFEPKEEKEDERK